MEMTTEEREHRAFMKRQKVEEENRIDALLGPYWDQGMKSAKSDLVAKAICSTNLTGKQVKRFIDKKKRRVKYADLKNRGHLPDRKKKLRLKKTRGYDKFRSVRMLKPDLKNLPISEQGKKMRVANAEWRSMPEDEKAKWKELAQEDNKSFKKADKRAKRMVKKVKQLCMELWDAGVVATLLLPPKEGVDEVLSVTHPIEMKPFWDKQLMDPVLKDFADEVKRCETLYQMRAKEVNEENRESVAQVNAVGNEDIEENGESLAQVNAVGNEDIGETGESVALVNAVGNEDIGETGESVAPVNAVENEDIEKAGEGMVIEGALDQGQEIDVSNAAILQDGSLVLDYMVNHQGNQETTLGNAFRRILGTNTNNEDLTATGSEVVDVESKSPADALNSVKAMAKKIKIQAAQKVTQKENRKVKRRGKLVGRSVHHLWEMGNEEEDWFNGVIMERDGDNYLIQYEGDAGPITVPVADFITYRRNKTLFVL